METLRDLLCGTEISTASTLARMLTALLLGLLVGFERQHKREGAGIRTFALICASCAAAMALSIWIPQSYPHLLNGDPGRIAAQILTGIGFLGAGCILQSKASVHGMTTAASVWTTAIAGMCVGAGLLWPGVALSALTLFVLTVLNRMERRARLNGDIKILSITLRGAEADYSVIEPVLKRHHLMVFNMNIRKDFASGTSQYDIKVQVRPGKVHDAFFRDLRQSADVLTAALSNL